MPTPTPNSGQHQPPQQLCVHLGRISPFRPSRIYLFLHDTLSAPALDTNPYAHQPAAVKIPPVFHPFHLASHHVASITSHRIPSQHPSFRSRAGHATRHPKTPYYITPHRIAPHLRPRPLEADVVVPHKHLVRSRRAYHTVIQPRQGHLIHHLTPEKIWVFLFIYFRKESCSTREGRQGEMVNIDSTYERALSRKVREHGNKTPNPRSFIR